MMFRLSVFLIPVLLFPAIAGAQPLEDLVHIRFVLDARVFAVMCAINAAGFDLDAGDLEKNPVRKEVRMRLQALDPDLAARLRQFYQMRDKGSDRVQLQSRYVSLALLLSGPPGFQLTVRPDEAPADIKELAGFELLLQELWQKGELERLWALIRPRYAEEAEAYRPLIRDMIVEVLGYARTEARVSLDRMVHLVPDLLSGYGVVNARNLGRTYIVVVGPSRTRATTMRSIRHEYLHFLFDPLVAKYRGHLPDPGPFMKSVREQPGALSPFRDDFELMIGESLIRTVESRLDGAGAAAFRESAVTMYDQGLILVPYFAEMMARFESGSEPLQEFFPAMIDGISWDKEKNRDSEVARLREELRTDQAKSPSEAEGGDARQIEIRGLLNSANRHLRNREFAQARPLLRQVLKVDEKNASALFGLAQIIAQEQDLDEALALYEQAAASATAGDTWIAGWSYLYRGNIYKFRGDLEQARREWARVLGLPGDLKGAREAAARALDSARLP